LKSIHGRRDLKQLQNDRLVASEHIACRNPEQHGVTDLSGGTCDRYTNWLLHQPLSFLKLKKQNTKNQSIHPRFSDAFNRQPAGGINAQTFGGYPLRIFDRLSSV
jgi:hypothetical protein